MSRLRLKAAAMTRRKSPAAAAGESPAMPTFGTLRTPEEKMSAPKVPSRSFVILPAFKVDDWDKVQTQFVEPHLEVANKRYGVRVVVVRVLFVRP